MFWGVTHSGIVWLVATYFGTPISSSARLGSGVITVREEKSLRFPIKLPLRRPSLPFSRDLTHFNAFPDLCLCTGYPAIELSIIVAT
jgi:hypothetical protein